MTGEGIAGLIRGASITTAEFNALAASNMTESQLQQTVIAAAKRAGWLVYHTHDSRRSEAGFPDLVLVHPQRGALFRELKTAKGKLTDAQGRWLAAMKAAGLDTGVWRPADWMDDTITQQLTTPLPGEDAPEW